METGLSALVNILSSLTKGQKIPMGMAIRLPESAIIKKKSNILLLIQQVKGISVYDSGGDWGRWSDRNLPNRTGMRNRAKGGYSSHSYFRNHS